MQIGLGLGTTALRSAGRPELIVGSWIDASTLPSTISGTGTSLVINRTTANARADHTIPTVAGTTYQVQFTKDVAISLTVSVGTAQGTSELYPATGDANSGPHSFNFTATGATSWLRFLATAAGTINLTVSAKAA